MNKKLFLIGNGFDIAHGLKTSYLDLMSWIYANDRNTLMEFNKLMLRNFMSENGYLFDGEHGYHRPTNEIDLRIKTIDISWVENTKEYKLLSEDCEYLDDTLILYILWESLEEHMYYFLLDKELQEAEMELDSLRNTLIDEEYGQVIESDLEYFCRPAQDHFDYLRKLSDKFLLNLKIWVEKVNNEIDSLQSSIFPYEKDKGDREINLLQDDFFGTENYIINFNYSETIEKLYSKKVCHIHGKDDWHNPPIMGHTKDIYDMYLYNEPEMILVEKFYKDFESILASHANYLKEIKKVDEIIVLGLGYNNTDYPYFHEINKLVPTAKWVLYYYSADDYKRAKEYVQKLNLNNKNVKYFSLKEKTPYTKKIRFQLDEID